MKRTLLSLLGLLVVLAAVVLTRTLTTTPPGLDAPPAPPLPTGAEIPDTTTLAQRLAQTVRFVTVGHSDPRQLDIQPFLALHAFLEASYPGVHATLEREIVSEATLLFTWRGLAPSLAPVLLLAHQDVVPAPNPESWTQPPFAGVIDNGIVWGRGTLDDKGSMLAILEAVEVLTAAGVRPQRTILLGFGHDEETGGRGAQAIAALLEERGLRPAWTLDEGLAVVEGLVPGIDGQAALVGIAEKGFLTLELVASAEAGHSSMPPRTSAVGRLSRALTRLEDSPVPGGLDGPSGAMFDHLAPSMSFGLKTLMVNRWLFSDLIEGQLAARPQTNALLRTTTALTVLRAGDRANLLPSVATAQVNFRVHPRDTLDGIETFVREVVDDPDVEVRRVDYGSAPSPVSSTDSEGFRLLRASVADVFPSAAFAPGLVLAATDSRHLIGVSEDVYRFSPMRLGDGDLARVHGHDERISVEDYSNMVRFYLHLLRRL